MDEDLSDLLSVVLEETGGLGVDIVIDSGGTCVCHGRPLNPDALASAVQPKLRLQTCNLQINKQNVSLFCLCEVRMQKEDEEEENTKLLPHKHDIISVLGVGGHWVTCHKGLQVTQKLRQNTE